MRRLGEIRGAFFVGLFETWKNDLQKTIYKIKRGIDFIGKVTYSNNESVYMHGGKRRNRTEEKLWQSYSLILK